MGKIYIHFESSKQIKNLKSGRDRAVYFDQEEELMIGFIIGLFLGAFFGFILAGILSMGREADEIILNKQDLRELRLNHGLNKKHLGNHVIRA